MRPPPFCLDPTATPNPHSAPSRAALGELLDVPEGLIDINSGSELILRQLFARLGQRVHLVTPTYALFPEIAHPMTETRLSRETDFSSTSMISTGAVVPRHLGQVLQVDLVHDAGSQAGPPENYGRQTAPTTHLA
jgi:hypothetical protein